MKVAVVGTRGFPNVQGGVETHCENLYAKLAEKGVEVTVYSRRPYVDPSVRAYRGVRLVPLAAIKQKFLEALLHTAYGIVRAKLDGAQLVHIHAIGPSFCAPLAKLLGLKVVTTHHGPDYARAKWNKFARKFLKHSEKVGARRSDKVISISGLISKDLYARFGVDSPVIPNGIKVHSEAFGEQMLQKYGLEKRRFILSVGRLVPEKGMHDLVDAFRRTGLAERGWKLVIVGGADHRDKYSLELEARARAVPGVVMTGFMHSDLIGELYHWRGLFVLASYHEGLPIVLLEALSHGPEVLVSDIAPNKEVGLPKDRYFETADVEDLARKIKHFAEHPKPWTEFGFDPQKVLEKYSWDRIADETLKVYQTVLGGRQA